MGRARTIGTRLWMAALAVAGLTAAGCSSGGYAPPFPTDPDPCASYCAVWVPPVYRNVPKLVQCSPGGYECETVCREETRFRECVTPGCYTPRCVPDQCRTTSIVQATPARQEWQRITCKDCCGCTDTNCWKRRDIPATYTCCEKHETELGYEYCGYVPPVVKVVPQTVLCKEKVQKYVPPKFKVEYCPELYTPGHYEWQPRFCCETTKPCPRVVSTPPCACERPRANFSRCPSQD